MKKILFSGDEIVQEKEVFALGMDRKLVGGAFVQGALPPIGEVVERIAQAGGTETVGGDAEDGQLLARVAGQGDGVLARDEYTMVGVEVDAAAHAGIFDEQADVAQCVILSAPRGTDDGDVALAHLMEEAYGFGLVVGLLFGEDVQAVGVSFPIAYTDGVAVADDSVGHSAAQDVGICRTVAAYDVGRFVQYFQGYGRCGIFASRHDDCFVFITQYFHDLSLISISYIQTRRLWHRRGRALR